MEVRPSRVVGVGASAGGLESLEKFFAELPAETGMAFVVVQHLSPNFKSLMTELLSRHCNMPVQKAVHGMEVRRDNVYLLPPKKEIIIRNNRLALTDKDPTQALTLPIDRFFRSLAQDAGGNAVAIVLSGSGSDGSRGVVEVKHAGGHVLVESSESADFAGMPQSAAATGAVSRTGTPAELARHLLRLEDLMDEPEEEPVRESGPLDDLFAQLRKTHGIDLSDYRPSTVERRLDRRLALRGHPSLSAYVEELRHDPAELAALYGDLLIGVTQFFRDPDAFRRIEREVIPAILERVEPNEEIRAWVAGCATGEEAYSLAMLFHEQLSAAGRPLEVKIIATDLDRASLEHASAGLYSEACLEHVGAARLERFFVKRPAGYQVSAELRRMIVFAPHNVVRDAPFTRMHFISCRNLLIYLQPPAQKAVLSLFHFGLAPSGVLMLGSSESPGALTNEFDAIDEHHRIFRKRRDVRLLGQLRLPVRGHRPVVAPELRTTPTDGQLLPTYDKLLDRYMPASFLVDDQYRLLDTFAGAERWLRLKGRRPTQSLLDMLDPSARPLVGAAITRALKSDKPVEYSGVQMSSGPDASTADVRAEVFDTRGTQRHILLEIRDARASCDADAKPVERVDATVVSFERRAALEEELAYTRETLQTTIEELETSNEELQATNEELIASNEELQSTNEELHSVNEELYTVNAEHQKKIVELRELNTDMQHLIVSSQIATVFLDDELRIRRYTPRVAEVFHILEQDVGRRIHDFSHNIVRPTLMEDLEACLEDGTPIEAEVRDIDGRPYFLRILAFCRDPQQGTPPEGVVMTLTDIEALAQTRSRLATMSAIVESSDDAIIGVDRGGNIQAWNEGATQLFGHDVSEVLGRSILELCSAVDVAAARNAFERVRDGESVEQLGSLRLHRDGHLLTTSSTVSPICDEVSFVVGAAVIARDVSELRQVRRDAEERQELVRLLLDSAAEAIYGVDTDGKCTFCNPACARALGFDDPRELVGEDMHALIHNQWPDGSPYPVSQCPVHASFREGTSARRDDEVFVRRDGTAIAVEYRSHPLQHGDNVLGAVVTFVDITARKRHEEELRTATRRREQFLAMLSHELRNPLAAVLNASAILSEHAEIEQPADEGARARAVIVRQARHMARLLDDLLDVSRVTSGKFQLRKRPTDLQDPVRAAMESLGPRVAAREVELVSTITTDELPVFGDPARLQQVVSNLLSNAVRYSPVKGRVELTVGREDEWAVISVRDQGEGIEPELLPQIFELFVQSDQALDRSQGGLGVGLTLVRQIVDLHGGSVRAHSEGKGEGSEFTVRLPLSARDAVEAERPAEVPAGNGARRVVLVEDQADAREMLALLLSAKGHTVFQAPDGPAGISEIERIVPDAAIVDIGLPTISGYDVARRVRANPALDGVLLVALTGYGAQSDIRAARDAGFDAHVTKPADAEKLAAILRSGLG